MYLQKQPLSFCLFFLCISFNNNTLSQEFESTGSGTWDPPVTLPSIPVSAANLPDGRVLTWAAYNSNNTYQPYGRDFGQTYTTIFDPATNQPVETLVSNTQHDMFCPGAASLPNGDIFVNGGTSTARTSTFNTIGDAWTSQSTMNIPRAYNASTITADGSVLTLGGSWAEEPGCRAPEQNCPDKTAEVWTATSGWNVLSGIPADPLRTNDKDGLFRSDNHMWLFSIAGGNVLHAGPSKDMHLLDLNGNGTITNVGSRADDDDAMNGNAVMYDIDKILITGGAPDYEDINATNSAFVVENVNGTISSRRVESMEYARAYQNSVVLPNGEVIVFGGQPFPKPFSDDDSVLTPELWNPGTEEFRPLAPMEIPRNYHSVALLLNDGRVLVGGGGLCDDCSTNHPDVEIFSPPYLFDSNGNSADRPNIVSAPSVLTYGDLIKLESSTPLTSIVLMRTSVVTHSVNNDQRRIPLVFSDVGSNTYHAQIPHDSGVLTPGNYMLFVLDQYGTPSLSKIVNIQSSNPSGGLEQTCNGLVATVDLSLGQSATAGDDVIVGTAGADVIVALQGDDTICGLGGNDTINAGAGDDWVDAGSGDDSVFGLDGADTIYGRSGADEIASGAADDLIYGDEGADILNSGAGNDTVYGGAGNDLIFAQGGDDLVYGGAGNDFIIGVDGVDELHGGEGNDVINGGSGNDEVYGEEGADTIYGLSGDDVLNGGGGDDFVFGQVGSDTIVGGAGNDRLWGNENDDSISDESGTNVMNGGAGNDTITGGSGNDEIFGDGNLQQAGNDVIDGGAGIDLLIGFAGADTITAIDREADTINGGPGFDMCMVESADTVFSCP